MHIERDGDRRWLVVDGRSPEQLWPQLQEFWQENGFALKTDAPATGIMVTDWAENRANIPDDWFRRTVGKVIDFAYSSGTRDSFRTLVSRGAGRHHGHLDHAQRDGRNADRPGQDVVALGRASARSGA